MDINQGRPGTQKLSPNYVLELTFPGETAEQPLTRRASVRTAEATASGK